MSASQSSALHTVAFWLAAAVERYDEHVEMLVVRWLDMDLYHTVAAEIDEIQRYSTSLPNLAVHSVSLLIAHCELIFALWGRGGRENSLDAAKNHHSECVAALLRAALRNLRKSALA